MQDHSYDDMSSADKRREILDGYGYDHDAVTAYLAGLRKHEIRKAHAEHMNWAHVAHDAVEWAGFLALAYGFCKIVGLL